MGIKAALGIFYLGLFMLVGCLGYTRSEGPSKSDADYEKSIRIPTTHSDELNEDPKENTAQTLPPVETAKEPTPTTPAPAPAPATDVPAKIIPSLSSMGYPILGGRQVRPANFMADMTKGMKVSPTSLNCPFADLPDIYVFSDAVIFTTDALPDSGYYTDSLFITWAHDCKLPTINGQNISFATNDPKPALYTVAKPASLPNLNYTYASYSVIKRAAVNFDQDMLKGYMLDFRKLPTSCQDRYSPLIYLFNNYVVLSLFRDTEFEIISRADFAADGCPLL